MTPAKIALVFSGGGAIALLLVVMLLPLLDWHTAMVAVYLVFGVALVVLAVIVSSESLREMKRQRAEYERKRAHLWRGYR